MSTSLASSSLKYFCRRALQGVEWGRQREEEGGIVHSSPARVMEGGRGVGTVGGERGSVACYVCSWKALQG